MQARILVQRRNELLLELRPDAVALVDSFGIEDYQLNSCLGRSDGDVYRALLEVSHGQKLFQCCFSHACPGLAKQVNPFLN